MQTSLDRDHISSLVEQANKIAIVSARKGTDGVAAAIALAEYISDKFSKNTDVVYPFEQSEFDNELLMLRPVHETLDPMALKVTLDYSGTHIESIDYHKEGGTKLILEIKPVDRGFDMSRLKTELSGTSYDLIITVGAKSLAALDDFYVKNRGEFDKASIINIDNSANNENYGTINIVSPGALNLSSLVLAKFGEWEYAPGKLAAKSLLIGISGS